LDRTDICEDLGNRGEPVFIRPVSYVLGPPGLLMDEHPRSA